MASADAFMIHQVGRRDRPGPVCEIAWRPDHNMPRMWTKRHRDHVARNRFSQTHPGVEPILDDVDQPPLGYDFDLHLVIATIDAHPPDQYAQLRVDLRSPSLWARLPTPVAAKAAPVPTHDRLVPEDCENLQD